jgi:hypothetical protein
VFIHVVQPIEATPGYSPSAAKRWKDLGIIFFKTYVGLVVDACKQGLLPVESIFRVAASASEEFERTEFGSEADRSLQRLQLNRDLTKANDFIHDIRQGDQSSDSGLSSSGDDSDSSSITWRSEEARKNGKTEKKRKSKKKTRRSGGFRLTARLVAALGSSRRSSTDLYIPYLQKQVPIRFAVGDAVVTCCGEGIPGKIIAGPRKGDGMYTVQLSSKFRSRATAGGGGGGGKTVTGKKASSSSTEEWYSSERAGRGDDAGSPSNKLGDGFRSKSYLSMSALASSFEMAEGTSSSVASSSAASSPFSSSLSMEEQQRDRSSPTSPAGRRSSVGSSSRMSSEMGGFSQRKGFGAMVYAPAAALKRVAMLPPGTAVLTPFGTGVLDEVRLVDGIHCVTMTKIYGLNGKKKQVVSQTELGKNANSPSASTTNDKLLHAVRVSGSNAISVKIIPVDESSGAKAAATATTAALSESMDASEDEAKERRKTQAAMNAAALESATKAAAAAAHKRKTSTGTAGGVLHRKNVIKGYLNARDVLRTLDAAVGDRVKTAIGDGLVVDYRSRDNTYVIKLFTGKSDATALHHAGAGVSRHSQSRHQFWSTLYLSGDSRSQASKLQRLPQEESVGNRCVIQ